MRKFLLISCASAALLVSTPAKADPITLAIAGTAQAAITGGTLLGASLFGGLTGFAAIAVDFAIRATLGYALNALSSKPDPINRGFARNVNQLGSALPHQIIYGETVVGGAVFYQTLSTTSATDDTLNRCIAFAGHEIESYEAIFLNDQEVTLNGSGVVTAPAEFANNVIINQYLGTDTQAADGDLIAESSEWTSTHQAKGIAYLYVRFIGASNFPTGIPVVSAKIRGRKVKTYKWAAHNLLPYSEQFDQTGWDVSQVSITTNATTDPDGGSTADQVVEDGLAGQHTLFYEDTIQTSAVAYTQAVWAKTNGRDIQLRPRGRGNGEAFVNFDLTNGTIENSGGTALLSSSIEDAGSGWYLCKFSFTSADDPTVGMEIHLIEDPVNDGEQATYTGDSSSGVFVWGAHFYRSDERGMVDSSRGDSYVATTTDNITNDEVVEGTEFSDNPAFCIRDYLLSDFGLSEDVDNIDDTLFKAAADYSQPEGGAKRFSCNGAFTLDSAPEDVIRNILSSMGGTFWNYAGNWAVNAAEYQTPTLTLTEDDLRGPIEVATRHSRRDNFNTVRGQYKGSETDYQPDDYTEVTSTQFLEEDNNVRTASELNLLFTDNEVMAQRIARTFLRRNRLQVTVAAAFGLRALDLKVGDNLFLTFSELGWSSKVFEVVDWRLGITEDDIQVNMILREMNETVYDGVVVDLTDESGNVLKDERDRTLEAVAT